MNWIGKYAGGQLLRSICADINEITERPYTLNGRGIATSGPLVLALDGLGWGLPPVPERYAAKVTAFLDDAKPQHIGSITLDALHAWAGDFVEPMPNSRYGLIDGMVIDRNLVAQAVEPLWRIRGDVLDMLGDRVWPAMPPVAVHAGAGWVLFVGDCWRLAAMKCFTDLGTGEADANPLPLVTP